MKKELYKICIRSLYGLPMIALSITGHAQASPMIQHNQGFQIDNGKPLPVRRLKDMLLALKAYYKVDILFSDQLVKDISVPENAVDFRNSLEANLLSVLAPFKLEVKKHKNGSYLVLRSASPERTESKTQAAVYEVTANLKESVGAASRVVSGKVTSESGEILAGVNVKQQGSNTGTITTESGNFSIQVPDNGAVLVFSHVGFITKEVTVRDAAFLNVVLSAESRSLQDVVVVGYGTQKKVNLTGAVSAITIDEKVAGRTITDVSSALSGLIPGLAVQQSSGMAGKSGSNLLIRGLGTVNDAGPLIVVDGMPDVDIDRLNMNDIESISVLKDAASASVYGSRASNGVILITTKTGSKKQKTSFNYSGTYALSEPTNFYHYFADYPRTLTIEDRAAAAGVSSPAFLYGTIEEWMAKSMVDPVKYPNTNWWDIILHKHGKISTHNLSASGGTDKMNFYISVGVLNQEGLLINNDYKRYNSRVNLDYKVTNTLKVGVRLDGQWSNTTYALANGLTGATGFDIRYAIPGILPQDPVTGRWGGAMAYGEDAFARNMLSYLSTQHNIQERQELNSNLYTEWTPLKGLVLRADYGLRYYNQFTKSYGDPNSEYNFQTGQVAITRIAASAGISNNISQGYKTLFQGRINYSKKLFGNHELSVLAAYNEEYWFDRNLSGSRNDRIYPGLSEIDAALTTTQSAGGNSSSEGLRSVIGRINYVINNKYLFETNARYDGSSKFLPGFQYGFFPSASVGWRFSEEPFLRSLRPVISSGKLRASIGKLGNNSGVGRYEQRDIYSLTNYILNGAIAQGFSSARLINQDFSWEETNMTNIGLDLSFMNGKLTAETDVYKKVTNGMIRPSTLSTFLSGYSAPRVNIGQMENDGIETNITWRSKIGKANFGAAFNVSYNKNRLLKWNEFLAKGNVYLNLPYHFTYTYVAKGIAQSWQDIENAPFHGQYYSPGDILYQDLNGDGQITSEDRKAVPQNNRDLPTMSYGLNLFGNWKGFDVSVLLQATTGRKDYWLGPENEIVIPTTTRNGFNDFFWNDTWNLDHRDASLPRLVTGSGGANLTQSTFWLENMDYLRLKNFQIGYEVPDRYIKRAGVGRFRLYLTAENLLTSTQYKGIDPERQGESSSAGNDIYPLMKSFSFGVNIGF